MKANEFITEAAVQKYQTTRINKGKGQLDRVVRTMSEYCSESIPLLNNPIFRGMVNHSSDALIIDPSTGVRKSQNTSNHYTDLIDHSPYMAGYPKRSKSLICTTSYHYSRNYGNRYAIFPFNGSKIALCPGTDMWETEVKIPELGLAFEYHDALEQFNDWLGYIGMPESYAEMLSYVKSPEFDDSKLFVPNKYIAKSRLPKPTPEFKANFVPLLQQALSPERTGFELMSLSEFVSNAGKYINKPRELWIGDKVLAVHENMMDQLYAAFMLP